jgi:hypothetical protein
MTKLSRRKFLGSSALGAAAVVGSSINAASSTVSPIVIRDVESLEAKKLIASTADWNDGLAHPIPYRNPPGMGKDRAIVLGGGSEYMSSFLACIIRECAASGSWRRELAVKMLAAA